MPKVDNSTAVGLRHLTACKPQARLCAQQVAASMQAGCCMMLSLPQHDCSCVASTALARRVPQVAGQDPCASTNTHHWSL